MSYLVPLLIMCAGASVLLWRLRFLRGERTAGPLPQRIPAVSIVVPTRNEAHNLPRLLRSLKALQPAPLEVIVVDDHSSDGTGEVARSFGVRVVQPPPMPDGWIGKPWACQSGAEHARGELILFTDADTEHAPDSLAFAVGELQCRKAGLVSIVPTHILEAFWEKLQGVYQLLLLVATRAGVRDDGRLGKRRFAIGQYLLFSRQAYEAIGRHTRVKDRLAEDIALAVEVAGEGYGADVLLRRDALRVRMYPEGLGAFVAGWRRSFRHGMTTAGPAAVLEIVMVIGWLMGIFVWTGEALIAGDWLIAASWMGVYAATAGVIAWQQQALGPFPKWSAAFYPVFVVLFVFVSGACAIDTLRGAQVRWRGRVIELAQ